MKTWYLAEQKEILDHFSVDVAMGLSDAEAKRRLEQYGFNVLPRGRKKTWRWFLLRQFKSPLVYILVIGALATVLLGEYIDTGVILFAVLVNVAVGFWQEFRSNNILEHLQKIVKVSAYVVREGETHEVEASALVPGDIILLKSGIKVPADARLIASSDLEINEAILTGESVPVKKSPDHLIKENLPVGDRKNMVHMGTVIEKGEGRAVVVATGSDTEIGMIALMTQATEDAPTPLQQRIGKLGQKISILVGVTASVIFLVGFFGEAYSFREMFTTAIAVAVAAIPEGLPAAISIVLAVSAKRILSQNGITKTLLAAETLGSASVICTDKTGTLTEGKMKVEWLINYGTEELSYRCLALANEAIVEKTRPVRDKEILALGTNAASAENREQTGFERIEISNGVEEGYLVKGETTDRAKMQAFIDRGGSLTDLLAELPRVKLIPFDSDIRYIASIHKGDEHGEYHFFLTGEPEKLIGLSSRVYDKETAVPLNDARRSQISKEFEEAARKGYRMIGLAYRRIRGVDPVRSQTPRASADPPRADRTSNGVEDTFFHSVSDADREKFIPLEVRSARGSAVVSDDLLLTGFISELVFVGFAAIRDPIREDVKASLSSARDAGIKPVLLTGDHQLTALAVGKELGFAASVENVMDGVVLDAASDDELAERIERLEIFARVNPRHKMRIIEAWRRKQAVVAMTGDGVNDAPALKSADIGVALGSGTDVAKEASDLILLDDSFSIIVSAIKHGRIAFDNIKKVTVFLLSGSFTELILIASSLILRLPLPVTAVQILWTNLVEDSLPNVALSFEPGEPDVMKRPPLKKSEPILDAEAKSIVFLVGIVTDFLLLGLFLYLYFFSSLDLAYIRTMIFASLGIDTFFVVFSVKSFRLPIYQYSPFDNGYLIGATLIGVGLMIAAVHAPFLNYVLGTVPLTFFAWCVVVLFAAFDLVGIETVKWIFRRKSRLAVPRAV